MMRSAFHLALACLTAPLLGAAADISEADGAGRVRNGLTALYDFRSIEENVVPDVSGLGDAADLRFKESEAVRVADGELELLDPAAIDSKDRPAKVSDMVRIAGEITLEAWIRPANLEQGGPATILTMSNGTDQRNFLLGQEGDRYVARFRTSKTDMEGVPGLETAPGTARTALTHLMYTRDRTGRARIFLDGDLAVERSVPGGVADWEKATLSLGKEKRIGRPWLGSYRLAAVYGRDLSAEEVARNFRAGPSTAPLEVSAADEEVHLFETKVAPLLAERCLECHDSATKQGGLDLSARETAFAGGANGPAIQPGNAAGSLVYVMTLADSMPKGRAPLSGEEKELLREWIDAGAAWSDDKLEAVSGHADPDAGRWVRRLTVSEYVETIRGAFGVDVSEKARELLPPDLRADGFKNTAYNLGVDLAHVEAYARLAEAVVAKLDVERLAGSGPELTSARITGLAERILRGPVTEHEVALYSELAATVVEGGGTYQEAAGHVIEAMLQSPRFLYRVEQQRGDGTVWPVDAHELAARLSYTIWGAPPDAELIAAADSGALLDEAEIERQAERMLDDPRAVERSAEFIAQWLDLDRLANLSPNREKFPDWDPALAADMRRETLAYFEDLVWKQERPLAELLNAQFSYLTPELAEHYGLEPKGPALERYDLASTASRGGLLTQGSVLTVGGDDASMVTRGLFVLRDLLYSEVGDPPPGLDTSPVPTSPGRSHRAIAMERVESPACGGCHAKFEPLAFGLEKFDGLGAFHEVDEHGNTLREDGKILFPGEAEPTPYDTAAEMMDLLASSERVQQNIARKLTQFAIGRPLTGADEPALEEIYATSQEGGGTYDSLIKAIVMSDLVKKTPTEF